MNIEEINAIIEKSVITAETVAEVQEVLRRSEERFRCRDIMMLMLDAYNLGLARGVQKERRRRRNGGDLND